jgi:predicted enzyme related to lactoylglutathione lyase
VAHNIVHFEIPADDLERARNFYQGLFGWKIEETPGQTGEGDPYYMIQTEEGALAGGMMKRVVPQQQPVFYVEVESLDGHVEKIKQAGGQIIVPMATTQCLQLPAVVAGPPLARSHPAPR